MRSLPNCALALGCAIVLGCGTDVDAEPAPSCITEPQLCSGRDAGVPTRVAISGSAPEGFEASRPTEPSTPPPGLCAGQLILCDGACVDPFTDPLNCGACGLECLPGQECSLGQCCEFGQVLCDELCTDVRSDELNCGTCGFVCDPGLVCVQGVCVPDEPPGF